jgi:ABC-type polysaccharide/polyol phosphate transport system ATPase subunit
MNKDNTIAIQLTNVNKTYTIHHEKPRLVETIGGKNRETFTALGNVSLTIKKGERVGIIETRYNNIL